LIESKERYSAIVIPGQPLQSNFSSSYPCGIWICDLEERTNNFVPLNEIRDDGTYHFFIHVDDENKIKNRNKQYHYSIKRQKVPAKKVHQDESVNSTIPDIFESVLGKAKFDNKKLAREKFDEIYKTISSNKKRSISETSLVNLRVRNFISIRDYELDFSDMSGNLLIQGMNGTGKTSLLEAIYWWLTGKTTKEISVSEIVHLESKLPPSCEGELVINQKRYSLKRSRDGGANLNLSMIEKDGTSYSLDKGSVSETQELIYSLLGLNASEILSLIYFSLEKLNVFTNLGPSDKHDFMKKISDANAIDEISVNLNEQFGNASLLKQ
jgi:hypothetical protein